MNRGLFIHSIMNRRLFIHSIMNRRLFIHSFIQSQSVRTRLRGDYLGNTQRTWHGEDTLGIGSEHGMIDERT